MIVEWYNREFEVPDGLVQKYIKDFEVLPGSAHRELVYRLRHSINEIMSCIMQDPELLYQEAAMTDFLKALATKKAMEIHGVMYDA